MKINKLDLAKTISDFMFLSIKNPEQKAKILFKLKHSLDDRGHGFEKYMQYYFRKIHNYKIELKTKTNQQDGGVDLRGFKKIKGKIEYLVVQCKKYSVKDITLDDVSSFFGKIARSYIKNQNRTNAYYITTTKFTKKARDFLGKEGIKAIDFEQIGKLQEYYPLEDFKKDLLKNEGEKEVFKSFNQEQMVLNLNSSIINTIEATDSEVFQLLKQVRRDLSNSKQLRLGNIAKNNTLELLARERPHNLLALKESTRKVSSREKSKLNKYGEIFTERLKYLHHEEMNKEKIKKDSFLSEMISL